MIKKSLKLITSSLILSVLLVSNTSLAATSRWVAPGAGTNSLAYSNDGINWIGEGTNIFNGGVGGQSIAWNGTRFIAVGQGTNTIAYSSDGINWTPVTNSTTIFSSQGRGIAWNGIRWVATGNGTNTIAYSDNNGITWTGLGTSIFSTAATGITWNGTRFIAVGAGTNSIAYSNDGINWTGLGTSIFSTGTRIAWNGTRFIAVGAGTNTLAYSDDGGLNWTGEGISTFSTQGRGIAWNGIRWVAIGNGTNSIAYSNNGINWTGLGTSIFTTSFGIAWNGTRFVATGNGTNTIAYSDNGINWTGVTGSTSIFSTQGNGGIASAPSPSLIPAVGGITIDAPSNLTASPDISFTYLNWTTPTDNGGNPITDYQIQYRTGSNPFTTYAHTASSSPSITITGLTPNTTYDFTVAAVDIDGVGNTSSISLTTLPALITSNGIPSYITLPPLTSNLGFTITNKNENIITLHFTSNNDIKYISISEDSSFSSSVQEPYVSTKDYTITPRTKTIYVKFYTQYGYSSQTYQQSITNTLPTTSLTKSLTSKDDIKNIQTILNYSLKLNLTIDGIIGKQTIQAIKSFQSLNNLVADGKVGPLTRGVLNTVIIK